MSDLAASPQIPQQGATRPHPGVLPEHLRTRQGQTQLAVSAFAILSGVNLSSQIAQWRGSKHAEELNDALMWTLVPALIVVLLVAVRPPRGREVWLAIIALGFSWLGDAVPNHVPSDYRLVTKIGLFQLAQAFFIASFSPKWRQTLLYRYPWLGVAHLTAIIALTIEGTRTLGARVFPALTYVACLHVMTALSTGVSRRAGVGGAFFLLSDMLIVLREFKPRFAPPAVNFWVISTYLLAQALIVSGLASRHDAPSVLPRH